jgi:integrase
LVGPLPPGCRLDGHAAGEIRALKWTDIDFDDHLIHVRSLLKGARKNKEVRSVPMLTKVEEIILSWFNDIRFNNIERWA